MTGYRKDPDDFDATLDALFAEARAEAPEPLPAAFEARLVEAALTAQPRPEPRGWRAWLRGFWSELGGAPSLAGVGVAGLAGVWIGFAAPGATGDLVTNLWQGTSDWTSADSTLTGAWSDAEILTLLETD